MGEPFSVYIHIPYCVTKCPYCDFNSHVVNRIPEQGYTDALLQELRHYAISDDYRSRDVQSIFFGGGTPSTFSPASIGGILAAVGSLFRLKPDCEITLEANPATVDAGNFAGYRQAGINRISIGVQSFQPNLLRFLGRAHSAEEAKAALANAQDSGFENFSFDLIYAIPGQTLDDLESDLDQALRFTPPHMSAYNLTFEEGTPFHREFIAGKLRNLSEDEEIAMAELIESKLRDAGLFRYEISNYAKAGRHSRHNVNYWRNGDYLGIGAGAHSYTRIADTSARRWSNEKNPGNYMAQVKNAGHAAVQNEEIDADKAASEFMFLGLRMTDGISLADFHERFGQSLAERYPEISCWIDEKLLEQKDGFLRFTSKGILLANSIFVHFM